MPETYHFRHLWDFEELLLHHWEHPDREHYKLVWEQHPVGPDCIGYCNQQSWGHIPLMLQVKSQWNGYGHHPHQQWPRCAAIREPLLQPEDQHSRKDEKEFISSSCQAPQQNLPKDYNLWQWRCNISLHTVLVTKINLIWYYCSFLLWLLINCWTIMLLPMLQFSHCLGLFGSTSFCISIKLSSGLLRPGLIVFGSHGIGHSFFEY